MLRNLQDKAVKFSLRISNQVGWLEVQVLNLRKQIKWTKNLKTGMDCIKNMATDWSAQKEKRRYFL